MTLIATLLPSSDLQFSCRSLRFDLTDVFPPNQGELYPVSRYDIARMRQEKPMPKKTISSGVVHEIPADLRKALTSDKAALAAWEDITPLARNEWICWTISVKKAETRREHVERVRTQLKEGKRRPCCWPGCPHR